MAQPPPCPYCSASSYKLQDQRWLLCRECGHEFDLKHDLCTLCGRLNKAEAATCAHCQAALRGDEVHQIIEARAKTRSEWQEQRLAIDVGHKAKEEEASRQRMEAYWADDRARREAAARAAAEQRQRERRVLLVVGIVAVAFILLLIVVTLILVVVGSQNPAEASELAAIVRNGGTMRTAWLL